ncbi:hypothetical protein M436DRAFT_66578 [Aureobasidium namibiae CBS 147.97]|uniref:BTB domain-containing protein n=1 Tax=Aureobasidium namibiae CBS 147.97 TaxID=1043004 RepID=A0A074WB63_9PEZI
MSFRDSISSRPATIRVGRGPHAGVFTIPKALLCNSSAYFKAALNRPFIEGQTQTIHLDDEDPSIFQTYVTWLYQGQLDSQDIEEELDDPQDFGLHIAEVMVFADKRDVRELKNDAISMLLSYLVTHGLASLDTINCVYNMPKSSEIVLLRSVLATDEVWHGHRLDKKIDHWHPEFLAEIIGIYRNFKPTSRRFLESFLNTNPTTVCGFAHKHNVNAPPCSSLVKNTYTPASTPNQQPPSKKCKIEPPTQTVRVLID